MLPTRRCGIALPLSLVFLVTTGIGGCSKLEELTGKKTETAKTEEKAEEKKAETEEKKAEEKKEEAKVEPAPIPVAPMLTGLDNLFSFVPDDKAEFMIVRDASVLAEYAEEGMKFVEGPLGALGTDGMPAELGMAKEQFGVAKGKMAEVVAAIAAAGLRPKEGGAIVRVGGKTLVVFAADKPTAFADLAKALGEDAKGADKCRAIESHAGWNVCADDQALLDGYKPAADPAPVRKALADRLPGVDLEEANLLMNMQDDGKPIAAVISTLPGLIHLAAALPDGPETAQIKAALQPGEAKTLGHVQPGAGFIWARVNPALLAEGMSKEMGADVPPAVVSTMKSLTGEFVFAGSVDPGGLYVEAGVADLGGLPVVYDEILKNKDKLPPTVPELKDSKLTWEKTQIQGGGATVDAFHVALTGVKELDVIKAYAGISADFWAFGHDGRMFFAVGPDPASVGKLLDGGAGGPSGDELASLPHQLGEAFGRNEVSFAVHVPADAIQGASMRKVIEAALKSTPDVKPAQVNAVLGFLAPLSSTTAWIEQPAGATVVHVAVQGVGNRSTDEGKAALAAAQKVAAGGDPATEFGALASTYASSPMAFAYHARAGTQGPGALVGSGLGAVALAGAIGYAVVSGQASPTLADDLGVKPEEPPPPLEIPVKPVAPTHEPTTPKKPKPKPDPAKPDPVKPDPAKPDPAKPDPVKPDPAKPDPAKPDPAKPDPVKPDPKPVEPPKPDPKKPPKPTPDPKKPVKPDPKKPVKPDPKRPRRPTG